MEHYNARMEFWWQAFTAALTGTVGSVFFTPNQDKAYVKRVAAIADLAVEAYEDAKTVEKRRLTNGPRLR